MRRALAVKVDVLDPRNGWILSNRPSRGFSKTPCRYLDDARELTKAEVAYPRPKRQQDRSASSFILWRIRALSRSAC